MLLYSHTITPRLQYVLHFLSRYYDVFINITTSRTAFETAPDRCKIAYSAEPVAKGEIRIEPHPLLFERGIWPVAVDCFEYRHYTAFFKTGGDLPFDLFAGIFFLLSRYEEYGPHQKDSYGRYAHEQSLAFQHNFLKTPLVNVWLEDWKALLAQKDPSLAGQHAFFTFAPTYDIDIAWSYKAKGWKRTAGGLLKAITSGRWRTAVERVQVLRSRRGDPYDAYDWLHDLHKRYGLNPVYFFLVAQQRGRFDKNPAPDSKLFQNLIAGIAAQYETGLHPSWQSGDNHAFLQKEKQFLETVSDQSINASRQHYIRFTLPQTFRQLIAAGISSDYSMGYGSINGFRASVATPFYWYDLEAEAETTLLLHPFCFMDANAYYEQRQSTAETAAELRHYYTAVKAVNGTLCTIWHNHFLGSDDAFSGWRELYKTFVAHISKEAYGMTD